MLGDVSFHKYLRTGDLERAQERAGRLVYGARSPVKLPWGGETPFKSYSPMEYVRCLESGGPEWSGTYNFLCEIMPSEFAATLVAAERRAFFRQLEQRFIR